MTPTVANMHSNMCTISHASWPAHHNQGLTPCALFHQCIGYRIRAFRHCKHWSHGCINKLQQHIYTISCHIVSSISWHVGIFIIYHGIKQVCIFLEQISTPLNKRTLSKNALRKPCLCHIIRSRVKNASSSSRVDPVVFMGVPVQLFDHIRIRSSGVTIPKLKSRGTPKVI